jgi:hypothetical protein
MSIRSTTQKRQYIPNDTSNDTFARHLDAGASTVFRKPWHKLERGMRLNRLRLFAEEETKKLQLSASESAALFSTLLKALDKKQLNSKTMVIYDPDKEIVTEVKGLVMHRGSDGIMRFQIVEKKGAVTFRKRRGDMTTGATATTTQQNDTE